MIETWYTDTFPQLIWIDEKSGSSALQTVFWPRNESFSRAWQLWPDQMRDVLRFDSGGISAEDWTGKRAMYTTVESYYMDKDGAVLHTEADRPSVSFADMVTFEAMKRKWLKVFGTLIPRNRSKLPVSNRYRMIEP